MHPKKDRIERMICAFFMQPMGRGMNAWMNIHPPLREGRDLFSGILPTGEGVFLVTFPDSDSCGAVENMLPCWEDK